MSTEIGPGDDAYVRQRFISYAQVQRMNEIEKMLRDRGVVHSDRRNFRSYDSARSRVRTIKRLMFELRKFEEWQLCEHVEKTKEGWMFSLEFRGRSEN